MSNASNVAPLLPYSPVRSFKPKEVFGDPKKVLRDMPKDGNGNPIEATKVRVGVVFGRADGVMKSEKLNPDGEITRSYGIAGMIEAIPDDRTRNPVRTSTAWFPTHIHKMMAEQLRDNDPVNGEVNSDGVETLEFAWAVNVKANSKSSTGFTWEYDALMDMTAAADPLERVRKALPPGIMPEPKALPAPQGSTEGQEDAPDGTDRGDEPSDVEEHQSGNAAGNAGKGRAKR